MVHLKSTKIQRPERAAQEKILPERVACKVCRLNYVQTDTLSIKVVPDDLYCDYNNLAQSQIRVLLTIGITISDFLIL